MNGTHPAWLSEYAIFSEGKEKLGFAIKKGQSQLFRYRVLIADKAITPEQMGPLFDAWVEESAR